MNRETSLYLDACRFGLAMVVFLGHASGARFTGGLLWQLEPYAAQAVAVFFVLSGFVIAHVTERREHSAVAYAVARAARVYSVALPALLATFALDALGRAARPELYAASWGYVADGRAWQFFSGLLFLNRIWGADVPQGSDLAYWSLGCEVWYYVIFGIMLFAPARWRVLGTVGALAVVGPQTALLFPLWLLGVWSYRLCRAPSLPRGTGWILCLGAPALWAGWQASAPPLAQTLQDYLVGGLFAAHLVGFRLVCSVFGPALARAARPIRWLAGASFTIYLFHLPIAQFLAAHTRAPDSWSARLLVVGGTLVALFAIAELTERRKHLWVLAFERLAMAMAAQPRRS